MRQAAWLLLLALLLSGCGHQTTAKDPLNDTLAGMPDGTFTSARLTDGILTFRPAPLGFDRNRALFRIEWEADVISHALAERQLRAHEETVRQYAFAGPGHHLVTGQEVTHRGFDGFAYHGARPRAPQLWQDADLVIEQRVVSAMTRFGLTPRRIEVLRPLGPIVIASATVPKGKVGWEISDLSTAAFPRGLDGWLLELYSPSGRRLTSSSVATRSRTGGDWFAPGQDERFGIMHLAPGRLDSPK